MWKGPERELEQQRFLSQFLNFKRPYVKVGFIVGEVIDNAEKVPRSKVRNESDQNAKARDHKKCLKQDYKKDLKCCFYKPCSAYPQLRQMCS